MENKVLIDNLIAIAQVNETWKNQIDFIEQNNTWLDYSAKIAVKILKKLHFNKEKGLIPSNQRELAEMIGVTPPYINKIVKGTENLTIETILKLGKALDLMFFDFETNEKNEKFELTSQDNGYGALETVDKVKVNFVMDSITIINILEQNLIYKVTGLRNDVKGFKYLNTIQVPLTKPIQPNTYIAA